MTSDSGDPDKALKELRQLGCYEDGKLAQMASWATARIFVLGGIKPVTKTLGDWLDDDRRDVRLARASSVCGSLT